MNEIKYVTTRVSNGDVDGEYIEQFDDIVKIELLPNNPTVGRYAVHFTSGHVNGYWTVGHPDSYVDYGGIRYSGEELEKLRNLLEKKAIERMLDRMGGGGTGEEET